MDVKNLLALTTEMQKFLLSKDRLPRDGTKFIYAA